MALLLMVPSSAEARGRRGSSRSLSYLLREFAPLPECGLRQQPCLPTPNARLSDDSVLGFAAQTRVNEEYGMPGLTRGNGSRFHKGVDILPVFYERDSRTVNISYYDHRSGRSFSRNEPVLIPKDEVFTVLDGRVVVTNKDSRRSGYGCYVMVEHQFADGTPFITMYAHLRRVDVDEGQYVRLGDTLGVMGSTSSNPGGRNYLKAIPHCHFEVGRVISGGFASSALAKSLTPRTIGGNYDPRNIQPYNPVEFLRAYRAQPRPQGVDMRASLTAR